MVASFSQIEPYIIQSESSGRNLPSSANVNYPVSTASGYYQITNTTWGGIPTSITGGTQSAYQAPFAQQQAAAQYLWNQNNGYDWLGTNPKTGQPWNSTAVAANNALMSGQTPNIPLNSAVTGLPLSGGSSNNYGLGDPNLNQLNDPAYLTGMPTYGDTTASDTTGLPYGGSTAETGILGPYGGTSGQLQAEGLYGGALHVNVTQPNTTATSQMLAGGGSPSGSLTNTGVLGGLTGATGAGTPVQLNLGAGTVQDITKWITAPITAFEQWAAAAAEQGINWFERGFLIFLAIVIIFVALWRLSGERGGGGTTRIVPIPA